MREYIENTGDKPIYLGSKPIPSCPHFEGDCTYPVVIEHLEEFPDSQGNITVCGFCMKAREIRIKYDEVLILHKIHNEMQRMRATSS